MKQKKVEGHVARMGAMRHVWTLLVGYLQVVGQAVAQLVEALRYKPERRGFDSRWCHWNFLLT
jgi:hypothetical protein